MYVAVCFLLVAANFHYSFKMQSRNVALARLQQLGAERNGISPLADRKLNRAHERESSRRAVTSKGPLEEWSAVPDALDY